MCQLNPSTTQSDFPLASMFNRWVTHFLVHRYLLGLAMRTLGFLSVMGLTAFAASVAAWDFAKSTQGWTANSMVTQSRTSAEGWSMHLVAPDPFLVSPTIDPPKGHHLLATMRMRSTSDALGQMYHGKEFNEERSRAFVVRNDGQWHEYQIPLPPLEPGSRVRIDPGHAHGDVTVQWVRLESSPDKFHEPWARPAELRGKKMIGGGQYTTTGGEKAVSSRFLAKHPRFTESYPFDGMVVPVVVDSEWAAKLELPPRDYFLHEILWNSVKIPYAALSPAIRDLNSVQWRGLTDNFLNYTLIDGAKGHFTPDLALDSDWEILEQNAALAARLCRETKLKGFWFDTEQYGNYRWRTHRGSNQYDTNRPTDLKFPLGKDTPELLQRRGAQWIKAVQREFPEVKIMITFAWSPDAEGYGPLKGTHGFFNGVLEGIQAPAQLIHGYENTFYYGQGPGTTHTKEGFPGDRGRFESAYASMRSWRSYSSNPTKYDAFLKVGMAAWVEDHPWNTWEGYPAGTKDSFWSNLPLALAYSDEYVWLWNEHTQYGLQPEGPLNPFLASLRNRTFNTGSEEVPSIAEEFKSDPLLRGWHFDFDMLAIGRKSGPDAQVPLMSLDSVPYAWDPSLKAVRIRTEPLPSRQQGQRRRYVHPIQPISLQKPFRMALDFQIDAFPKSPTTPILLGLFSSGHTLDEHSLLLRVEGPSQLSLLVPTPDKPKRVSLATQAPLEPGKVYRLEFENNAVLGKLRVALVEPSDQFHPLFRSEHASGRSAPDNSWDELGAALSEIASDPIPSESVGQYRVLKVSFGR
jgi:hypothetical protein